MRLPLPSTLRLLALLFLVLSGMGRAMASSDADPLKDLVDDMRSGQSQPAEAWLEVLVKQPSRTTTTLAEVLREDGELDLLHDLEGQLRHVCAFAADLHAREPQDPATWAQHCRISMEIVELCGESPEVHALLNLLAIPAGAQEADYDTGPFHGALRICLLKACERDEATLRVLERAFGSQTRSLDAHILRILGDCDAPSTPDTLARCLGKRRNFDGIVLTQIASALRKPHLRISEFGLGAVRPMLSDETAHTRQSAARALGYADDTRSVRPLILLLKDPSESVRSESLQALQRITAMTIEGHPDRWLNWFDEETEWWLKDSRGTLQALRDSTQKDVARTLRQLAGKRLFRRELAAPVMDLLDDPRPDVVRLALATLESLRPPLADLAPHLQDLSQHPSPLVRNDAARILSYLTSRNPQATPASSILQTR